MKEEPLYENYEEDSNLYYANSENFSENFPNVNKTVFVKQEPIDQTTNISAEEFYYQDTNFKNETVENVQYYVHEGLKTYKCDSCDKTFGKIQHLKEHKKSVHEKNHKCNLCGKAFGRPDYLRNHITSVHEGIKNLKFKCPFCGKCLSSKQSLDLHIGRAHAGKDTECHLLNIKFLLHKLLHKLIYLFITFC